MGPGNCPICGMALEPLAPSMAEAENPELVSMTRRFWVALILTVPMLLFAVGELMPSFDVRGWIERLAAALGLPT